MKIPHLGVHVLAPTRLDPRYLSVPTPELTRGNRKSQLHKFTGEWTSKVKSHYLSRSQWLHLLVEESRVDPGECPILMKMEWVYETLARA